MDWKILFWSVIKSLIGTILGIIGFAGLFILGNMFHAWANPWDLYVIAVGMVIAVLSISIVETYKKAIRKKGYKTSEELLAKMFKRTYI